MPDLVDFDPREASHLRVLVEASPDRHPPDRGLIEEDEIVRISVVGRLKQSELLRHFVAEIDVPDPGFGLRGEDLRLPGSNAGRRVFDDVDQLLIEIDIRPLKGQSLADAASGKEEPLEQDHVPVISVERLDERGELLIGPNVIGLLRMDPLTHPLACDKAKTEALLADRASPEGIIGKVFEMEKDPVDAALGNLLGFRKEVFSPFLQRVSRINEFDGRTDERFLDPGSDVPFKIVESGGFQEIPLMGNVVLAKLHEGSFGWLRPLFHSQKGHLTIEVPYSVNAFQITANMKPKPFPIVGENSRVDHPASRRVWIALDPVSFFHNQPSFYLFLSFSTSTLIALTASGSRSLI